MPKRVGDFEVHMRLGRGGSADVYSATRAPGGETLALKVLKPGLSFSESERSGFLQEAQLASRIDHPGVIRVDSFGQGEMVGADDSRSETAWIALELLRGRTLAAHVREHGPLMVDDALALAAALLDALSSVHRAGLVHRDVTPANVILDLQPGEPLDASAVRLIDFGIAGRSGDTAVRHADRATGFAEARSGTRPLTERAHAGGDDLGVLGNPLYISPEQAQGSPVTAAADLYQLGGLLHFALTGVPPFAREDPLAAMSAHVSDPAAPPPLR